MSLPNVLADLRADPHFMANVAAWRTIHAQTARYGELPQQLHLALRQALLTRGIARLYTHQAQATELALQGQNVAVVTPTASGKTLCYNLPVFNALLTDPGARALYLFPTKALAHDQLNELADWLPPIRQALLPTPLSMPIHSYDGDTPSAERARVRKQARVILTNPDMLHTGILPYHANWEGFFSGLRYVVLDEMHTYRGVFGSHVANVLRRLQRVCHFYGAHPQYVCTSATIANPAELAERLLEQPVSIIEENGAPLGDKHIILYNPPLYDPERGLRQSSTLAAQELAGRCVLGGVQTIVFGRSRLTTEVLLTYLRDRVARTPTHRRARQAEENMAQTAYISRSSIRGYRGGYLPTERRAIEAGLRSGEVRAVVATNALELGIDIGQLQAAVLCGYPGSIASTWQQMGRAGRTTEAALAILIATGGALDQYVLRHPEFIFERSPEHALINPDNLMLLVDQLRCAAFELPFAQGDHFGQSPYTADVLDLLAEQGDLHRQGSRYFWSGLAYPSRAVSLRSTGGNTVAIQSETSSGPLPADQSLTGTREEPSSSTRVEIIGEIDRPSAPLLVYDGAIYLHEGQSYLVQSLDLTECVAHVAPVSADFYTDVFSETAVEVLAKHEEQKKRGAMAYHGDLRVEAQVIGYRRIKRFTHETLGVFPLDYPPHVLETSGYWFSISADTQAALEQAGQWRDSINDYGPNWEVQRQHVRARDEYRCTQCGAPEPVGRQHDVHHLVPFRTFGYVPELNELYKAANRLDNLVLVCRTCHRRLEAGVRVRGGLDGLSYAVSNIAPLYLMCDRQDIGVHVARADRAAHPQRQIQPTDGDSTSPAPEPTPIASDDSGLKGMAQHPTIYIYERAVAGLGFSARLFELHNEILNSAHDLIRNCPCPRGCPACVGPVLEDEVVQMETKKLTLSLLEALQNETPAPSAPASLGDVDFGV